MKAASDAIVESFERGQLTRRQLVARLMALGAAAATSNVAMADEAATAPAPTFAASGIDHVALSVTDVKRSTGFYQKHLGLRYIRGSETSAFLATSDTDFLALFRGDTPGLHHFSFSIPDYDPDDAAKRIENAGLKLRRSGDRVYFPDPDGLTVQVHPGRGLAG